MVVARNTEAVFKPAKREICCQVWLKVLEPYSMRRMYDIIGHVLDVHYYS